MPGLSLLRLAALGGIAVAAVAWLSTAGLSAAGQSLGALDRPAPQPDRLSSDADGVAVIDGETLRLAGQVVRLRGVEAPARGSLCGGQDCGNQAASALAGLVRDRAVSCRLLDRDRQGRPLASCEANGMDLGRAIIASGWAHAGTPVPDLAGKDVPSRQPGVSATAY